MTDSIKRRRGTITLEQAKKKFNDYYNNRWENPIGQKRAKLFDMMYQKKPKFTLKPGEPGSERYLLEEGPRTFDMVGVDSFPEGEKHIIPDTNILVQSRGSTFTKKVDNKDNSGEIDSKIYGPRLKNKTLFSKHFREIYEDNKKSNLFKNQLNITDENDNRNDLVEIYWEKYRNNEYKRKNKKKLVEKNNEYHTITNLEKYSGLLFNNEVYIVNDNTGEVFKKKNLNKYNRIYNHILDDNVPEQFKQEALDELILKFYNGKYSLNNDSVFQELMDDVNDRVINIFTNGDIYVYEPDDDTDEFVLLDHGTYDSLEEYIQRNNIEMTDLTIL